MPPDNELDQILEELKNDESISSLSEAPSAERLNITDDNVNDYVMQKVGRLIESGIETVEAIQQTIASGFEAEELQAFSGSNKYELQALSSSIKFEMEEFSGATVFELQAFSGSNKYELQALSSSIKFEMEEFSSSMVHELQAFSGSNAYELRNVSSSIVDVYDSVLAFSGSNKYELQAMSSSIKFELEEFSSSMVHEVQAFSGSNAYELRNVSSSIVDVYNTTLAFSGSNKYELQAMSSSIKFELEEFSSSMVHEVQAFSGSNKYELQALSSSIVFELEAISSSFVNLAPPIEMNDQASSYSGTLNMLIYTASMPPVGEKDAVAQRGTSDGAGYVAEQFFLNRSDEVTTYEAPMTSYASGTVSIATTQTAIVLGSSTDAHLVRVTGFDKNMGIVCLGGSNVGWRNAGRPIEPGESFVTKIDDIAKAYINGTYVGDGITWLLEDM